MRTMLIAMVSAAGIALLGTSSTLAAPGGGAALLAASGDTLINQIQMRRCRDRIRYRNRTCTWAACGVPPPGTHRSRCGYRCPGTPGLIWNGWC